MEITDIKIFKTSREKPVLAYANVILNNSFIIRNIALIETERGKFISMPSKKLNGGKKHYRDVCHPLNSDIRQALTEAVFDAYYEFLESEKK